MYNNFFMPLHLFDYTSLNTFLKTGKWRAAGGKNR